MTADKVKALRLQRAWSQEQLAEAAGVSSRTIQRIENGANPGLETLKALAAVFGETVEALQNNEAATLSDKPTDPTMTTDDQEQPPMTTQTATTEIPSDSDKAREDRKAFYQMGARFGFILLFLLVVNLATSPGYLWVQWPALGMALAIIARAASVFGVWGEKRND